MQSSYKKYPIQSTQYDTKNIHVEAIEGSMNSYVAWLDFTWTASNGKTSKSGKSQLMAMVVLTSNGYGYRICAVKNNSLYGGIMRQCCKFAVEAKVCVDDR